ncbi:hypothetical protein [Chlorobaculum parvum]|uniref:hypothetical protein n=1 Tax=Chlorobaculum parvum TaxID=274539 RepID=UPI00059C40C1|nr:hypothetical protein [Chlorobaculum parvum]
MPLQKNTIKMICTTAQKMKSGLALKSFVHQPVERKEKAARRGTNTAANRRFGRKQKKGDRNRSP